MSSVTRRKFLRTASAAATAGLLATACAKTADPEAQGAPAVHTGQTYRWKMVTTWPPGFKVLGEGASLMAGWIREMSGGKLDVQVFGANELVPPFESFEAVQQGVAEMGHAASYYWRGKATAASFFCAVPFGMNAQQMNAWLISGGGLELWRELYADFGLIPFPCGNTGVQMGGWFKRKINAISDFKGLKMRIPGLGAEVIKMSGGTAVGTAGNEIYTSLERGVIDATEWIGPYHDYLLGFPRIAEYYYYPGWHEPGAVLELFVNKSAFEGLPANLQHIVETAAGRLNPWILAEFDTQNAIYLKKIVDEFGTKVLPFPDDVLEQFRLNTAEVIEAEISKDQMSKRVYESFSKFKASIVPWSNSTERYYYSHLQ